jgi:hypothetical protein
MHTARYNLNPLRKPLLAGLSLAIVLVTSACSTATSVSSNWHDRSYQNAGFKRVLVVGVTENTDRRMTFEDAVVNDLRSDSTLVWASSRLMPADTKLTEASMNELAKQQEADAVIVTRVTSLDVTAVEVKGRTDVVAQRKKGTIFRYDYIEKEEQSYTTSQYETTLTTDVYPDMRSESIYTVAATATKQETLADVIDVLSDVIAKRLRRDGVIR